MYKIAGHDLRNGAEGGDCLKNLEVWESEGKGKKYNGKTGFLLLFK